MFKPDYNRWRDANYRDSPVEMAQFKPIIRVFFDNICHLNRQAERMTIFRESQMIRWRNALYGEENTWARKSKQGPHDEKEG